MAGYGTVQYLTVHQIKAKKHEFELALASCNFIIHIWIYFLYISLLIIF